MATAREKAEETRKHAARKQLHGGYLNGSGPHKIHAVQRDITLRTRGGQGALG